MLQPSTLKFLRDLKANNNRDWFHSQASRYEKVKKDYKFLAGNLLAEMQKADTSLAAVEPKHCTFRIARDIRFSPNKTPYKTNLGVGLPTHGKKSGMAEYYLHIEEGTSFCGGGIYMPDANQLKKIRKEIDVFHEDLEKLINEKRFKKIYGDIDRDIALKKSPRDYPEDHPAIDFLKLKSYTAIVSIPDELLTSPELISTVTNYFTALKPFLDFLNRALLAEDEAW
jgi:uncharacterized protein (TIGR02453 family)